MLKLHVSSERLVIAVVSIGGFLACFFPSGVVPQIWTMHGILLLRKVAVGLLAIASASILIGRWSNSPIRPLGIMGMAASCLIVAIAIFRMASLGGRSLPNFDSEDPRAGVYYRKACAAGVMEACARLGNCYWTGSCGLEKDGERGVELYQRACDGGDMPSCGQLGTCYEFGGCGLQKMPQRAVALYEKACTGGDFGTCNNLGVCYHKGQCGLSQDEARAAQLYDVACRGGDSGACHNLDLMKR